MLEEDSLLSLSCCGLEMAGDDCVGRADVNGKKACREITFDVRST